MDPRIDQYFREHSDEMIRDICSLIAIKSVKSQPEADMPYGRGACDVLHEAIRIAERKGVNGVNFENYAAHFDLNAQKPTLGILAHLDVVAEGDGWTVPPYEGTVKDGRIYGRGSADDKGPAMAALYALCAAREIEPELSKGARLILGTDEETGSSDIAYYKSKAELPPYVFSPDADYPVINIEKGRYAPLFSCAWDESGALPRCVNFEGGHTANIVPQYAKAAVEGMSVQELTPFCGEFSQKTGAEISAKEENGVIVITAAGKSAHAANPKSGVNAQTALLEMLAALPLAESGAAAAIRSLSKLFPHGDVRGSALGIAQRDDVSGALTLNFSILKLNATGFKAKFDCRFPICAADTLVEQIDGKFASCGFITEKRDLSRPHCTPESSPFVQTLLRVYEDYTGNKGKCIAIGGGTYVHDIEGGVAFGCTMPGTDNKMHGADEFAVIDELILSAKMFTQVILDMCR